MKKVIRIFLIVLAIIVLLPFLIATFRPNLIVPKAEVKAKFTQPNSHFVNWRGAEIHYTDEGSGVPVVMIHGLGGSFLNWNKLRDRMKDDYRVIRIDLPGFGMSDMPQVDAGKANYIQQYRDFMSFMLDTLHVDSVYLVGNSMGGMMSWGAAADHPYKVKKLVLIAAAGYDLENVSNTAARMLKVPMVGYFLKHGFPLSFSEGNAKKVFFDPTKINPESVKNNNSMWNRDGNIPAAISLASSGQFPDSSLIATIKCPTLVIWGKDDKIVPVNHAYRFQRDIKGSQLVIFDSCGHCAMIEMPDETAAAIKSFFVKKNNVTAAK